MTVFTTTHPSQLHVVSNYKTHPSQLHTNDHCSACNILVHCKNISKQLHMASRRCGRLTEQAKVTPAMILEHAELNQCTQASLIPVLTKQAARTCTKHEQYTFLEPNTSQHPSLNIQFQTLTTHAHIQHSKATQSRGSVRKKRVEHSFIARIAAQHLHSFRSQLQPFDTANRLVWWQ